jgi:hypothetical protein
MSVEFSNTYQEILFDNLISIIKQNFHVSDAIKTCRRIQEKSKAELQAKYNELFQAHEAL